MITKISNLDLNLGMNEEDIISTENPFLIALFEKFWVKTPDWKIILKINDVKNLTQSEINSILS